MSGTCSHRACMSCATESPTTAAPLSAAGGAEARRCQAGPSLLASLRAMSAVVYLRESLRLPVNRVQQFLADAGLELS